MSPVRVLHVPGHAPYARKLADEDITPVNGTDAEVPVPLAASVDWLLARAEWDFFDVLHLHSVELVDRSRLADMLAHLHASGKRLIFTAHDVVPNIDQDHREFEEKTRLIIRSAHACVTLTGWARDQLVDLVNDTAARRIVVAPHGYAIEPGRYPIGRRTGDQPAIGVYGALRTNRALGVVVAAWRALADRDSLHEQASLRLLLRSVSAADVRRYAPTLTALNQLIKDGLNVDVRVAPAAVTDSEIVDFHRTSSVILLPYRWCTHSGQLELCFDLGVPVIAPRLGGLEAQAAAHPRISGLVTWFDGSLLSADAEAQLAALIKAAIAESVLRSSGRRTGQRRTRGRG